MKNAARTPQREIVALSLILRPSPRPPKPQHLRRDDWARR
jgi:hypothetical protein